MECPPKLCPLQQTGNLNIHLGPCQARLGVSAALLPQPAVLGWQPRALPELVPACAGQVAEPQPTPSFPCKPFEPLTMTVLARLREQKLRTTVLINLASILEKADVSRPLGGDPALWVCQRAAEPGMQSDVADSTCEACSQPARHRVANGCGQVS